MSKSNFGNGFGNWEAHENQRNSLEPWFFEYSKEYFMTGCIRNSTIHPYFRIRGMNGMNLYHLHSLIYKIGAYSFGTGVDNKYFKQDRR